MRPYGFSLSAGQEATRSIDGAFVRCDSATGEVYLTLETSDGRSLGTVAMRAGKRVRSGVPFSKVRVENQGAASVDVTLEIGALEVDSSEMAGTVTVSVPDTVDSANDVTVGAGSAVQVAAARAGRRYVMVTNLPSNSETLRVGGSGAAANNGTPAVPGQTVTHDSSGAVYAYNPGAAAQDVAVVEVY